MQQIGQKDDGTWRFIRRALVASVTVVLAAACAAAQPNPSVRPEPAPRTAMRFSAPLAAAQAGLARTPSSALAAYVERVSTFQHWGLTTPTLLPPAPPARKPVLRTESLRHREDPHLPPVISRVPTRDRVVFLTVDDGTVKDPEFIRMVRALDVPVSSFLTHDEAGNAYGTYFRQLYMLGGGMQNHSISHPELPNLSYEGQREELCRQQRNLRLAFGESPLLFRPPYGSYDGDTLRAARDCGLRVVVMWSLEAWPDRIDWQMGNHRLRPGDIILTHFRGPDQWGGSMTDMTRRVLREAAAQGFAVARLEDYI